MRSIINIFVSIILVAMPLDAAKAGYLVVGPIKAEDCYHFGITYCSEKTVTAVKVDGKMLSITNYFEGVSSYNEKSGRCFIYTKDTSGGVLAFLNNKINQPEFWGLDGEGRFGKIDADLIKFDCIRE